MVGGVYCPLSCEDPKSRLYTLLEQTKCNIVLVDWMTQNIFDSDVIKVNIDVILNKNQIISEEDFNRISNVLITGENMSYIIFTSGSTGLPKAVKFVKN
jgi:non-ribosomal peptide synthetase component F